jgi:predicted GIY-YIG superfamily endonuclease
MMARPTEGVGLQERGDAPPGEVGGRQVRTGVYAIRNTDDGAVYVGSSTDIDARWEQHRTALDQAFHHDDQLQAAWDRSGAAAFELVILERVGSGDSLAHAEQRWIDRYSADDLRHVYNSQTRSIRKLRKLLALDETAQRLGLRPATLRRWVDEGLVACHGPSPDGPRGGDPGQIGFDPEEVWRARHRMRQLEGHRVAEIVARLHQHREQVRRWLRRGRYLPLASMGRTTSRNARDRRASLIVPRRLEADDA